MKDEEITMIPGVEPILLDLENLFLLSVSLENLIFQGKTGKKETRKNRNLLLHVTYNFLFVLLEIRIFNRPKKEINRN